MQRSLIGWFTHQMLPTAGAGARLTPGALWQRPNYLSHHLLPSWVYISRKLEADAELRHESKAPSVACSCAMKHLKLCTPKNIFKTDFKHRTYLSTLIPNWWNMDFNMCTKKLKTPEVWEQECYYSLFKKVATVSHTGASAPGSSSSTWEMHKVQWQWVTLHIPWWSHL